MARATIKFRLKPGECRTVAGTRVCNRWQSHTAEASGEYTRGVQNPRRPWGKCTCEAADRYKTGVDRAHSQGAYRKGVKKRGSMGWRARTLRKGPTRFADGVMGAGDAYARGYKPYHAAFPSIFMPKRFPRGDPRNIQRCRTVCTAMGRVKTSRAVTDDKSCPTR